MSKELEQVKNIELYNENKLSLTEENYNKLFDFKNIKLALEVLEIIVEKKVHIFTLVNSESVKEYNLIALNPLTENQFNKIKEYLEERG